MPKEQKTYTFTGIDGIPSTCQLAIYRRPNFDVVIVENAEDDDETLAIKRIEAIATGATDLYQLDPDRTTWITPTPAPLNLMGEFRKIPIESTQEGLTLPPPGTPWAYLSKADVEAMIDERLE